MPAFSRLLKSAVHCYFFAIAIATQEKSPLIPLVMTPTKNPSLTKIERGIRFLVPLACRLAPAVRMH
jgi:hypothetical protein